MERIVVAISPPSIFTLGSLAHSRASPVKSYGCRPRVFLVYHRLCSGYGVVMLWVLSGASVVGGRNPP
jgi:hypothetical protein